MKSPTQLAECEVKRPCQIPDQAVQPVMWMQFLRRALLSLRDNPNLDVSLLTPLAESFTLVTKESTFPDPCFQMLWDIPRYNHSLRPHTGRLQLQQAG